MLQMRFTIIDGESVTVLRDSHFYRDYDLFVQIISKEHGRIHDWYISTQIHEKEDCWNTFHFHFTLILTLKNSR